MFAFLNFLPISFFVLGFANTLALGKVASTTNKQGNVQSGAVARRERRVGARGVHRARRSPRLQVVPATRDFMVHEPSRSRPFGKGIIHDGDEKTPEEVGGRRSRSAVE